MTGGVSNGGALAGGFSNGGAGGASNGGASTPAATAAMPVVRVTSKKTATTTFLFILSFTLQ